MPAKSKKDKAAFRAQFDPTVIIPNKIRAALVSLAKDEGAEGWEKDAEFLRRAGLNAHTIQPYRDGFKAHTVEAKDPRTSKPAIVWFSDTKVAASERNNLGS